MKERACLQSVHFVLRKQSLLTCLEILIAVFEKKVAVMTEVLNPKDLLSFSPDTAGSFEMCFKRFDLLSSFCNGSQ